MAHPRKLIRHAAVARLIAASTAAGTRVEATREEPNRRGELPAIGVYTSTESVEEVGDTAPRELTRVPELHIVAWVGHSQANPADDRMDDIAEQIEAAMESDRYLGGTVGGQGAILTSTDMRVRAAEGNDPIVGIIVLTYSATYYTSPAVGPLDDFLTAKATHDLVGGVTDTVPAIDEFTVQEIP